MKYQTLKGLLTLDRQLDRPKNLEIQCKQTYLKERIESNINRIRKCLFNKRKGIKKGKGKMVKLGMILGHAVILGSVQYFEYNKLSNN